MLTKKDYVELARIIRDCTTPETMILHYDKFMKGLCFWLRMDNPNFDESRFRETTLPARVEALELLRRNKYPPKTEYTKRR